MNKGSHDNLICRRGPYLSLTTINCTNNDLWRSIAFKLLSSSNAFLVPRNCSQEAENQPTRRKMLPKTRRPRPPVISEAHRNTPLWLLLDMIAYNGWDYFNLSLGAVPQKSFAFLQWREIGLEGRLRRSSYSLHLMGLFKTKRAPSLLKDIQILWTNVQALKFAIMWLRWAMLLKVLEIGGPSKMHYSCRKKWGTCNGRKQKGLSFSMKIFSTSNFVQSVMFQIAEPKYLDDNVGERTLRFIASNPNLLILIPLNEVLGLLINISSVSGSLVKQIKDKTAFDGSRLDVGADRLHSIALWTNKSPIQR